MSETNEPQRSLSAAEPTSELRRISIHENGEPLVDFMELCPALCWVSRHPVFDYERFRLLRRTPTEMLACAQERLPQGIRLAVVEGWRPPEIQRRMHEETRARLRREHPEWSDRHLAREANRFSAPMDRRVPPPHTTGGAVDVHLVDEAGEILDFISPYDLMDRRGAPRDARGLSPEARRNRKLLQEVMEAAGLTNYPSEWWHWSYGDQGWAYRGRHPRAVYGATEPPDLAGRDFTLHPRKEPGW
ncbi:MAG: M15 family metallopeptidase [Armatimonadota bacterium]